MSKEVMALLAFAGTAYLVYLTAKDEFALLKRLASEAKQLGINLL